MYISTLVILPQISSENCIGDELTLCAERCISSVSGSVSQNYLDTGIVYRAIIDVNMSRYGSYIRDMFLLNQRPGSEIIKVGTWSSTPSSRKSPLIDFLGR